MSVDMTTHEKVTAKQALADLFSHCRESGLGRRLEITDGICGLRYLAEEVVGHSLQEYSDRGLTIAMNAMVRDEDVYRDTREVRGQVVWYLTLAGG